MLRQFTISLHFYFTFRETLIYFRAKSSGHRAQARVLRQRVSRCVSRVFLALLHFYTIFCVARKQSRGRDTRQCGSSKNVFGSFACVCYTHQSAAGLFLPLRTTHTQQPAVRPAVLFAARFSLHFCVNSLRALAAAAAEQLSRILRCFFYSLER